MTGRGGWPMSVFLTPDLQAVLWRHVLAAERRAAACPASTSVLRGVRRGLAESPAATVDQAAADDRAAARRATAGAAEGELTPTLLQRRPRAI